MCGLVIILSTSLSSSTPLRCDVCIVGAGAVGISMALALADSGLDVIVAEAGDRKPDATIQDAYAGTVVDEAMHSPLTDYRERRLGGSSTVWGGRCMPLDPIDYQKRDWMPHSGWPIGPEALAPFYPRANRLCEAGEDAWQAQQVLGPQARPMIRGFAGRSYTTDRLERSSCPTDFARRYGPALEQARNIRLLLRAPVTAIELTPDGTRVAALSLRDAAGAPFRIEPREVVVATGGLESARLLLASRDIHPHGIGNHHDVLGRYYQAHLAGTIGTVTFDLGKTAIWHGYDRDSEGVYVRRRLALTDEAQRAHRLGNVIARLHHPRIADPAHGTAVLSALYLGQGLVPKLYRKRLAGVEGAGFADWLRHVANVARNPFAVAGFADQMLLKRKFARRKFPSVIVTPRKGRYSVDFHAEQVPNPASRVFLGDTQDALGMPRLVADWHYLPQDVATVQGALALLAQDLAAGGLGRLDYDPAEVEAEMIRYGAYPGHHIGTVRMGDDPASSMVDADCRIHGVAGLSVVGTAVFPTSSQANPTLTAIALGLRLADRLQREAKGASAAIKAA
jgi:choline dehydrogenase-like flavoprotein